MAAKTKVKKLTLEERIEAAETLTEKLSILTSDLGKEYANWKKAEEAKDLRKGIFFDLLDDFISDSIALERVTERVILKDGEDIDLALESRYPDMRVVLDDNGDPLMEENPEDILEWIVVLENDPRFMKYSFVNPDDAMVYTRGRTERGAGFDTLGFVREFPDLAKRCVNHTYTISVSTAVDLSGMDTDDVLALASDVYTLDESKAEEMVVADPTLLATFMKFRIAPKISMTLAKPRKAKADEL